MTKKITNIFRMMALGLSVAGGLLVCEVIRPFHDFSIDGPIALSFLGNRRGARIRVLRFESAIAGVQHYQPGRQCVVPPLGALVVWWLMSQSNFAWH